MRRSANKLTATAVTVRQVCKNCGKRWTCWCPIRVWGRTEGNKPLWRALYKLEDLLPWIPFNQICDTDDNDSCSRFHPGRKDGKSLGFISVGYEKFIEKDENGYLMYGYRPFHIFYCEEDK